MKTICIFVIDTLVLIQFPRRVPVGDIVVNAFNFTTLLPTPGIVLPNVENADYGIIETRNCGCLLEQEGFTEHLQVRSFRKLTGKGMTLVGNDIVRILQEVLPVRIGGSPLDYQLVEEDDNGFTRLSLAINPTVKIVPNESAVIDAVLSS